MANNILAGQFTVVYAKASGTFLAAGLSGANTLIMYEIGAVNKSWNPARGLNSLTGLTAGKGYMIRALTSMDNPNFYPPFPTGSGTVTYMQKDF